MNLHVPGKGGPSFRAILTEELGGRLLEEGGGREGGRERERERERERARWAGRRMHRT